MPGFSWVAFFNGEANVIDGGIPDESNLCGQRLFNFLTLGVKVDAADIEGVRVAALNRWHDLLLDV